MAVGDGTDPSEWGIEPGYHDVSGQWRPAEPDAVAAALAAMGAEPGSSPPSADVWVVTVGSPIHCDGAWTLHLEDGTRLQGHGSLPPDVPLGYHDLIRHDPDRHDPDRHDPDRHDPDRHGRGRHGREAEAAAGSVRLIVTPPACHLPPGLRVWGWAAQLYAVRSTTSWGMGDLADLAALGRWSRSLGAGVVLLNPLHAALPGHPQQASPYYPSSRCFQNPLYLRVEDVPGAAGVDQVAEAARAGRALNERPLVDRDAVWDLKMRALEAVWQQSAPAREGREAGFAAYGARRGQALERYATFCAIGELHGRGWAEWPAELRRPDAPGVAAFAVEHADRVRFHAWLQWLLDEQLERAGSTVGVVTDLAIGTDPAGVDAWLWQDALAMGVRVGAPPDEFNTAGQDWGFPPYDPWRLRAAGFEPFIQVVRSVLAHAAGVRIDHVAGLFRLFWIPPDMEASRGLYVRYPWQELLAILALESVRAGAWVVGEDLGTVEPYVREELARREVLSTRVMWFEPEPPAHYPPRSLAVVSTHDLPTVAGVWTGADVEDQEACGIQPDPGATAGLRHRLTEWTGLPAGAPDAEVIVAVHRLLAEAPSAVVLAQLEDALGVPWRPNLPGTVDERPNWSRALPAPLEAAVEDPLVVGVAEALGRDR